MGETGGGRECGGDPGEGEHIFVVIMGKVYIVCRVCMHLCEGIVFYI